MIKKNILPVHYISFILAIIFISSCVHIETTSDGTNIEENNGYWPTNAWQVSLPEDEGMDGDLLQQMLEKIDEDELALDSLVVVHNGYIVAEKYFPPYEQDYLHETYSVTKGIVSALIGIAIEQGYINSINDRAIDFFPDRVFQNDNAVKQSITIEDLLTMTSGLQEEYDGFVDSTDWVQYILDQPMSADPGTEFYYYSGNTHLLSAIIQESSGMETGVFAQFYLFGPLGIKDFSWDRDPLGCQDRVEMSLNHRFKKSTFQRSKCQVVFVKFQSPPFLPR